MSDGTSPATILVADDDRITRELLAGLLRGHGFRVEQVGDGQELVDRVARGGLDLVLTDIVMPKLSGLEACRIVKSMSRPMMIDLPLYSANTFATSRI